jgi:hypothetical protein
MKRLPNFWADGRSEVMPVGKRQTLRASCVIFLLSGLFFWVCMSRSVNPYDEGSVLLTSARVLEGSLLYRDNYAVYGPAQYYTLAGLFKWFGVSILTERVYDLVIRALIAVFVYVLISISHPRRIAILATSASVLWLGAFRSYGYPVFPCLLLSLIGVYLTASSVNCRPSGSRAMLAGASGGVMCLFRHDVAALALVGGALDLMYRSEVEGASLAAKVACWLKSLLPYFAGFLLVLVPVAVGLIRTVGIDHIFHDLVWVPSTKYVEMRSLPFPSLFHIGDQAMRLQLVPTWQLVVYFPILSVICGLITLLGCTYAWKDASNTSVHLAKRQLTFQLTLICGLFFLKGVVRVSPEQMAISVIPAIILLFVVWDNCTSRRFSSRTIIALSFAYFFVSSAPAIWRVGSQISQNTISAYHGISFDPSDSGRDRIAPFFLEAAQRDAIHYLRERQSINEYLYVGLTRHDKIFVGDSLFYFASEMRPATKWHHFDPGVQTTIEVQTEMIAELRLRAPKYVVLRSDWDHVYEPNASARSSGVTVLDEFLRVTYGRVATFGTIGIYKLNDDSSSASTLMESAVF